MCVYLLVTENNEVCVIKKLYFPLPLALSTVPFSQFKMFFIEYIHVCRVRGSGYKLTTKQKM